MIRKYKKITMRKEYKKKTIEIRRENNIKKTSFFDISTTTITLYIGTMIVIVSEAFTSLIKNVTLIEKKINGK